MPSGQILHRIRTILMVKASQPHILIFEPRSEGHHLSWLRYVAEDLLGAGFRLTLAVDCRTEVKALIKENLSALIDKVSLISIFAEDNKFQGGSKLKALAHCLDKSGAQEAFVNNLDDIVSHCLRAAAVGIYPPRLLQGRLSGVYFRPRFLKNASWPPGNIIKAAGFQKLCRRGWFKHIFMLDEYMFAAIKNKYGGAAFHFLPDPWDGVFSHRQNEARQALDIPQERFVLLNYGMGDRRKGLHLTVHAMLEAAPDSRLFLLCAGKLGRDRGLSDDLARLAERKMAKVMNRYVSDAEESLCFCAADVVVLPYVKHFGSSGVLSLAAAAGKMVIASDEGLVAQRIQEHKLGWLFPSRNVGELKNCLEKAASLSGLDLNGFRQTALAYSRLCSREAFRNALLSAFVP